MKKYPYIGKWKELDITVFFTSNAEGFRLDRSDGDMQSWSESKYTNITHEYLSNTWGIVESKEHAEFIIELAELHGFTLAKTSDRHGRFFVFDDGHFAFLNLESLASKGCKQITIPLPPKAKEWVCVGESVTWGNKVCNGEVKAIDGDLAWIKNDYGNYVTEYVGKLQKPKTEQDLKIEELQTKLCNLNAVDNYILASEIVMGNVEGLSYEGK